MCPGLARQDWQGATWRVMIWFGEAGMAKIFICGLDVATATGCADGWSDEKPRTWTWDLRDAGKGRPQRLAHLMRLLTRYFQENAVDALFYEQGLSLGAAHEIGMAEGTMAFLRGALGVTEAVAATAKIPIIEAVNVQDARQHLVGQRRFPKGQAKQSVFDRCRVLRWNVADFDQADAAAIWSFGVGKTSPLTAHLTTPLFSGRG